MSSLTIDELKKILADNGVPLPSGRLKKEDYVTLYEQNLLLNGSTEPYSDAEDDSQNSRKVTSSNRYDPVEIAETVSGLTDDDLYEKLVELGFNAGPIVPSSRTIYEKKLLKLLQENTNGTGLSDEGNTNGEFSDQEERARTPTPSPPARRVSVPPPEVQPIRESSVPRRYTFIEKISRVSKERIIEPVNPGREEIRFRGTSDISDGFRGSWSPSATIRAHSKNLVQKEQKEPRGYRALFIIGGLILLGILVYVAYYLLPGKDQYELLEDDAVKHAQATGSQTV